MKKYSYKVCMCDGHFCNGTVSVLAETEEDAYEKVMDYVLGGLSIALPELDIDVYLELASCVDTNLLEDLLMEQQEQM